jgi:hypothetical protein
MTENPIVEEIHRIREQMLADCGGDMQTLVDCIRKREEESARAGRKVVSLPPRPVQRQDDPARKVG